MMAINRHSSSSTNGGVAGGCRSLTGIRAKAGAAKLKAIGAVRTDSRDLRSTGDGATALQATDLEPEAAICILLLIIPRFEVELERSGGPNLTFLN